MAEAKCDCARATDDPQVDMHDHAERCARRRDWDETKERAFIIDHKRASCALHLEPFREAWPKGFAVYAVKAFQMATAIPGIWDEALRLARPSSCTTEKRCATCRAADAGDRLSCGLAPLCLMSSDADPEHYGLGVKALEAVLDLKPACCRLTDRQLIELYVASGVGVAGRCRYCKRKRLGTPITAVNLGRVPHVCFWCLVASSVSPITMH